MYDRFKKYLNKWLKENGVSADTIDDWLIGDTLNNPNIKTTCNKDCSLKRTPYHVIYKYKTQKLNVNTTTTTTPNIIPTTTTTTAIPKSKSKISNNDNNNNNSNDSSSTTTTVALKQETNDLIHTTQTI
jgi:hypothetical protein